MENKILLTLNGERIENYSIVVKTQNEATVYAASELMRYILKATGKPLSILYGTQIMSQTCAIVIENAEKFKDGFSLRFDGKNLLLTGNNERSAIYAVYEFLERIGWRFFTQKAQYERAPQGYACEKLLTNGCVEISQDFCVEQEAVFDYRDGSSFALGDLGFCVKMRINAQTWGSKRFPKEFGGARTFAYRGCEGHTFGKLVPIDIYGKTNPEFFAEVNGVRKTEGVTWDTAPQLCLTKFNSVPV
ncbi:MAG: hypothetical protein IJB97_10190, partial [Clostridia bacterium]|nr:hypothetical protein [Clostridia bacterium]